MRRILTESVTVGNATARAMVFKSRMKEAYFYPNSAWCTPFVGGSDEFLTQSGVRNLDARTVMFYYAQGITPAMSVQPPRLAMKLTGCRLSPVRVGTSSFAYTARSNRGSTRRGNRASSNW
jgi:hypothetical protein